MFAYLIAASAFVQVADERPTLDQAQRCSAIAHVASMANAENEDLFQADLYWSLAATEIARDADVTDRDFAAAQDRARTAAAIGNKAALDACLRAVPSLLNGRG